MAPFTLAELKEIVFSMHPEKAPGLDGFTALLFQKCWEFIGNDVLLALEESRRNRSILRELNTTLIAIIPKVDNPTSFSDFHLIALCTTLYKIFTKAISVRLSRLLPRIVSLEQGGFVPGRETSEGVNVAHEVLHSISQQKVLAMILKLDMLKAYDRVNWQALRVVLYHLGFSSCWVKEINVIADFLVNKAVVEDVDFLEIMFRAGSDTSSVTLEWALSLLLRHPHVMRKAQEELDSKVGWRRVVEESDIPQLTYLQAIVKETLCFYPAAPLLLPQKSEEACTVGGYHIPAETIMMVNAWEIHRDPKVWNKPLDFKPERMMFDAVAS
ncbi:cytochrome P450 750A1 [Cryptomeria japonica]|uniref:cytochrome P450 750A1 n=1 Tax=Cryptomeria japonica TaxID=3369 RepID=UPI0027DA4637|nr:cytochrome P450 750A1 [Cryptomeria japonica]